MKFDTFNMKKIVEDSDFLKTLLKEQKKACRMCVMKFNRKMVFLEVE